MIQKVLSGKKRQVDIAKEAGIGRSTLSYWLREYKKKGTSALNFQEKSPKDWTASEKMEALIATGGMVEEERNRWCRTQGLFAHHLNQWKKEAICAFQKEPVRANDAELKRLKKENSALQIKIDCKDRALSETAALLVLKKKSRLYLGGNQGRLISEDDKNEALELIREACDNGARKKRPVRCWGSPFERSSAGNSMGHATSGKDHAPCRPTS